MITIEGAVITALLGIVVAALVVILRSRATRESVTNLESRLVDTHSDLDKHKVEDREDFNRLRQSIETLRVEISGRIDRMEIAFKTELSALAQEFRLWAAAAHGTPRATRRKAKPPISRTDKQKR